MRIIFLMEIGRDSSPIDEKLKPLAAALQKWSGWETVYQTWQIDHWDEVWIIYQSQFWPETKVLITDNSSIFKSELGWTALTDWVIAYWNPANERDAYHITHELNHLFASRRRLSPSIWYDKVHELQRELKSELVDGYIVMPRVF